MIDTFQTWFSALGANEQTFWGIAIIASVVFLVQAILTLVGMDAHADMDMDIPEGDTMDTGGAMSLFSIRSLVNFFVGFGWAGVSFLDMGLPLWLVYTIAVIIGFVFAYLYIYMRRKMMKLEHNGAFKISDCIGLKANVYLRIPAQRTGKGKVQVSVNGSILELDAMTDGDAIPTGMQINILSAEGSVLIVQR